METLTQLHASAPATLKLLIGSSVGYLLSVSLGTVLAQQQGLPADSAGFGLHSQGIVRDFVNSNGTALSPHCGCWSCRRS
jgi:hypothetical protein